MRQIYFLALFLCGISPTATFGQGTPSDLQTLRGLLSEVPELRQDLRASLGKIHIAQIPLSRLQMQEIAVSRASQHLDDSRSKLSQVQAAIRREEEEVKYFGDPPNGERTARDEELLSRVKSDLEASSNLERQRQTIEIEAEEQLRTEQDKLTGLEAQLDEIVRTMGSRSQQVGGVSQKQP